jgi:AhpD family alkylhydroperoxidase
MIIFFQWSRADLWGNKNKIMNTRINVKEAEPAAYRAMYAFDKYVESGRLTRVQKDLIKIRASQINRCAYCVDMHTRDAREAGESEQRIYALTAWRDTPFFTPEERALLAFTEEVTLIGNHVSDETYAAAAGFFDDQYLSQILMTIIYINAWNRIGISTAMQPERR